MTTSNVIHANFPSPIREGATVRFRSKDGITEGIVNGTPFEVPDGHRVPVWVDSERTGGSCLYVHATNILLPGERS